MEITELDANKRYITYLLEQKKDEIKILKDIERHLINARLAQQLEGERK